MQLHLDRNPEVNHITSYGPGYFVVNERRIQSSIIVSRNTLVADWSARSIGDLDPDLIKEVAGGRPELVILGTGARHRFPKPTVLAPLSNAKVGVEVMGTGAACRTYNVLLAENRDVLAMLLGIERAETT